MMMSGGGRSSSAVDTLNAAASVIAAGDNRSPQLSTPVQKRRWGGFWNLSGCVVSRKQRNRIVDAVLVPDPIAPRTDGPPVETRIQAPPAIIFPFIAPPSSPASFHHSEPSSVTLSPANGLSLDAVSKSMYSSDEPSSMFAVGPYAHETQLVSPPVPSTYTTEPSTAPFTPPPESVYHLTTPSSPEVPFARLLDPIHQNVENGIYSSGVLSPLPDDECRHFINIRSVGSRQGSGTMTPDATESLDRVRFMQEHRKSYGSSRSNIQHIRFSDDEHLNHRLSFEITAEEVTRCVEKKPVGGLNKALLSSSFETLHNAMREREDAVRHPNRRPLSPMSAKEFNFDNVNRGNSSSSPPVVCSNWWANEKVLDIEGSTSMAMAKFANHA